MPASEGRENAERVPAKSESELHTSGRHAQGPRGGAGGRGTKPRRAIVERKQRGRPTMGAGRTLPSKASDVDPGKRRRTMKRVARSSTIKSL